MAFGLFSLRFHDSILCNRTFKLQINIPRVKVNRLGNRVNVQILDKLTMYSLEMTFNFQTQWSWCFLHKRNYNDFHHVTLFIVAFMDLDSKDISVNLTKIQLSFTYFFYFLPWLTIFFLSFLTFSWIFPIAQSNYDMVWSDGF